MGHYSDNAEVEPLNQESQSANRTIVKHDPDNTHEITGPSDIKEESMAEGGAPVETPIPLIPPPPRTTHKQTPDSIDSIENPQELDEPIPEQIETEKTPFEIEAIEIAEEILERIEEQLEDLEDIPDICNDIPIECFCEDTQHQLCYHLDPVMDAQSDMGYTKDYMGFGEWIGLETLFMRYLNRTVIQRKTIEVLGKWITFEGECRPTIGNFKDCMLNGIDRPDVVMDLAKRITKDAISWVRTGSEACTVPHTKADKSWQLTRHDVVTGKRTYYTCCLVYADEDEGMAQIITKLYKSVHNEALFFLPQFDLKVGKYELNTTATVIQERCQGRVIFILSEYFFASEVCRFAVEFSRATDAAADAGNLIPFHLTNQYEHVPRLIKGIAGIRWFRRTARKMSWTQLTDTILGGRMEEQKLEFLKTRLLENIDRNPDLYLCDPPYDVGTPSPGPPIDVHDPPLPEELAHIYDPTLHFEKMEDAVREKEAAKRVSLPRRMVKTVKKQFDKFFKRNRSDQYGSRIALAQPIGTVQKPDPHSKFYDTSKMSETGAKSNIQLPMASFVKEETKLESEEVGTEDGKDKPDSLSDKDNPASLSGKDNPGTLSGNLINLNGRESATDEIPSATNGEVSSKVSNMRPTQTGDSLNGICIKDEYRDNSGSSSSKSKPALELRRSKLEPEENDDRSLEQFV